MRDGLRWTAPVLCVAWCVACTGPPPPRLERMAVPPPPATSSHREVVEQAPEPPIAPMLREMLERYEANLADPDDYAARVAGQAARFPEGDLFPYALPAYAYANLAAQRIVEPAVARARIAALLPHALAAAAARSGAPGGELAELASYRRHATYLGHANAILAAHASVGGRSHEALHEHLSSLLFEAVERADGRPLHSFPNLVWPFDTVPVLASLHRRDARRAEPAVRRFLAWMREHATDGETGLWHSQLKASTLAPVVGPRGCEASWRIALLAEMAPEAARQQYSAYTEHFWLDRSIAAGFAEWPGGRAGAEDLDSGPIVMGIGSAASALGIATALSQGDDARLERLVATAALARRSLPALVPSLGIERDEDYDTGFLYGDAVLFYVLSFVPGP